MKMGRKPGVILISQIGILIVLAALWEIAGRYSDRIFFVVGTPTRVFDELINLLVNGGLLTHMAVTGSEAFVGLVIGTSLGSLAGLSLWYSQTIAKIIRPFVVGIGAFPILALAPLMILWFGVGFNMKVALAVFSTIFVAFSQAFRGASSVGQEYIDHMLGMRATKDQIFRKIIVPGSLEWVFSSMRLNVGFALLGAFIGEFIASSVGLGYIILRASSLYNVPRAIAAAIGIIVLGLVFDYLGSLVERKRLTIIQVLTVPRGVWKS